MTMRDLVTKVSKNTSISRPKCKEVIEALIDEITFTLSNGEDVQVRGLANFEVYDRTPRNMKDFKTGKMIVQPSTKCIRCKISRQIKDAVKESLGEN